MKKNNKFALPFRASKQLNNMEGDNMDNITLENAPKSKSIKLSMADVYEIMDRELEKDPDEVDMDLVHLCTDLLEKGWQEIEEEDKAEAEKAERKKKIIKFSKLPLIAAVFAIAISIAIPINARYVNNDSSGDVAQFLDDHFKINLNNNFDLVKELETLGYDDVILPAAVFNNDYSKDDISVITENDLFITAEISIDVNSINDYISITRYKTDKGQGVFGKEDISEQCDSVKQITVNGMDVVILYAEEESYIRYINDGTEYTIYLKNCDLESSVKIAKTLKH